VKGKTHVFQFVEAVPPLLLALFSLGCLIRSLGTRRMFCFASLVMFGDVSLKANPAWFWFYGLLNVLGFVAGTLAALGALASGG
jgi:hypothetical protein